MAEIGKRDRAIMTILIYLIIITWLGADILVVSMLWAHHKGIHILSQGNFSLLLIFGIVINITFGEIFYRSGKEKRIDGKNDEGHKG